MWTIEEIQSDESLRRKEFPICRDQIFLAHAAVCPVPASVSKAIQTYASACELGDQEDQAGLLAAETRALASQFLGVGVNETALVGPTSLALSFIATGFSWKKNDHVLVYFDDYPSNVYPWMALSEWGVEVRFLNIARPGLIRPKDILGQIDENTRMVALASCHFLSGFRIEVDAIGKILKDRGIAFCLDAIQTIGAFPTPLKHVDFMAADAHKWLLGPCAAGLMVVKKEMQSLLHPTTFGWHNVACPDFVASEDFELRNDARKYEAGSHNLMGLAGLKASLKMLQQVGVESIAEDLLKKRKFLSAALIEKGYQVLHAGVSDENSSGILAFYRNGEDMSLLHQSLKDENCQTSLRTDRDGNRFIRLSPHFYNTQSELEQFLALV